MLNKKLISAIISLLISAFVLFGSIFTFAWFLNHKNTRGSNIEVHTRIPVEISFYNYYYDKEDQLFVSSSGTDVSLQAYDSIFLEYNTNLERVLEIEMSRVPDYGTTLSLNLLRTNHNDTSLNQLNQYSSSIIEIDFYITPTKLSTDKQIWSSAVANSSGNYVFTTKTNNTYSKSNNIQISHVFTQEEKNYTTLYAYLVFSYSSSLIDDFNEHYNIFDSELGNSGALALFENDIDVLEVEVS